MIIGTGDKTGLNGQFDLYLTAENPGDQMILAMLRRRLEPINFVARHLDPKGTGDEFLVIPLEHLLANPTPVAKPLPDSGFRKVINGLASKRR